MSRERESNMELLRIVSMLMVVIVHADGAALGLPQDPSWGCSARDLWRIAVESLTIIGVNCFTLISGYFGIRLRVRSVCSYLFQCAFYAVGIATWALLHNPAKYSLADWGESWMVLTHTDLWYVPAYFALMLLSPIINEGMGQLSRKQNLAITAAFVAFNLWGGWLWGGKFNPTGYTVIQLVMVYMTGRLIALYPRPSRRTTAAWAAAYLAALAGVFCSAFYLPTAKAFAYNSPAVLLMSVAFFCCFLGLNLHSKRINTLAKSAFAVYLVHKAPPIWADLLKPVFVAGWTTFSLGGYTLFVIAAATAIYLLAAIPDLIRRAVWSSLLALASKHKS